MAVSLLQMVCSAVTVIMHPKIEDMKKIIFTIILCAAFSSGFSQKLTLRECIDLGVERNLSLHRSNISTEIANNRLSENRSRLLPMLDANFQFTDFLMKPTNVTTGTLLGSDFPDNSTWQQIRSMQYGVNAGIQLSMPIFNKTIFSGIDVAKTMVNISRISIEQAKEELTVAIANTYYLAQASCEQASLLQDNIKRMQELCEITQAMYEGGVVMEVDLSRVKINISNIDVLRKQYITIYEQQLNLLRFLLDFAPEQNISVGKMEQSFTQRNVSGVSDNLPALRLIAGQKELIDRQISTVKAGYLPSIALFGQLGANGYQDKFKGFFNDNKHHWFGNSFLGIKINVPIFDGNIKKKKINAYHLERTRTDLMFEERRKALVRDYNNVSEKLELSISSYRTQQSNYLQALSVFNVTEERYKEGVASMTDLLQDEMRMRESQIACIHALCECNLAYVQLLKLSDNLNQLK